MHPTPPITRLDASFSGVRKRPLEAFLMCRLMTSDDLRIFVKNTQMSVILY